MIIAQISDTHILAKSSTDPVAAKRADNLRRCVADINHQGVDAVIHTGDSVHHGSAEEYDHLAEILSDLKPPLFVTLGNRDRHDGIRTAFSDLRYLPRNGDFLHYVIENYPIRLIALDSVGAGERKGVFCEQRLAWLENTLAREPKRPTLLFIHHPPFDIADHYVGGYRHSQDAERLAAVVKRHPQVERLLCGHVHCLHNEPWGGTIATTMPSVAVDLRKGIEASLGETPLYLLHEFSDAEEFLTKMRVVAH